MQVLVCLIARQRSSAPVLPCLHTAQILPSVCPQTRKPATTPCKEICEAGGLTTQCSVPQGTSAAPALLSFTVEGPFNGDKCCEASNFKDRWSRLLQSGATRRRVRRTSGATWRGGTGARVTDARTDAQSRDRRAPRQGAG